MDNKIQTDNTPDRIKLPLEQYYDSLSNQGKIQFVGAIGLTCGVAQRTVMRWVLGETKPRLLEMQAISRIAGKSVKKLFPDFF